MLAIKAFGKTTPLKIINKPASLLDIAPTILDDLNLPELIAIDGVSLNKIAEHRALLMETGYKVSGIEEAKISVAKVIKQASPIFQINPQTGLLFVNPTLEKSATRLKQRAVLSGDWLLARLPDEDVNKLVPDKNHIGFLTLQTVHLSAYFVIVNLKTGQWTIGLDSPFAKIAPTQELLEKFNHFYGDEI